MDQVLGLSLLRLVWLRRHLVGLDRRRATGVLLSDRAVCGSDALRRVHRRATRDWVVDGDDRVGGRCLPVAPARPADRRDHRVYVRRSACHHGPRAATDPAAGVAVAQTSPTGESRAARGVATQAVARRIKSVASVSYRQLTPVCEAPTRWNGSSRLRV